MKLPSLCPQHPLGLHGPPWAREVHRTLPLPSPAGQVIYNVWEVENFEWKPAGFNINKQNRLYVVGMIIKIQSHSSFPQGKAMYK